MYTNKYEVFLDSIYKPSESYTKAFFYRWYRACGAFLGEQGLDEDEIIAFMREHPIDAARAWKYCPSLDPKVFAARHWTTYTAPTSEEDAFKNAEEVMLPQEKDRHMPYLSGNPQ